MSRSKVDLPELAPVGGRATSGRDRRRFERFAQIGFAYSAAVRSVSQGRASFTMAPLKYSPASAETAEAYL
jgi:hypothetical protein